MPTLAALSFTEILALVAILMALGFTWAFALAELFRRTDVSGRAKAGWLALIVLLPPVGAIAQCLTAPRNVKRRPAPSAIDELERLDSLRVRGRIDDDEFARLKEKALR